MSAAAPAQQRRDDAAAGWLTPRSWRLEDAPPGAALLSAPANGVAPPLLLLIERQQPLAEELRQQLTACLSNDEHERHQAYRLPADRRRFLLGRGGLRLLLGAWLQRAPEAVPLQSGPHGKPHCPIGPQFNVSHSGDLILLALHPSRPVGVDVERLRPGRDWWAIARRVLPAAEQEALAARPAAQRPDAFLAAWCRLEARLKARGTGLAGLEQLRQQERQADRTAPTDDDSSNHHPGREPAAGGQAPSAGRGAADQQPRGPSPAGERVWDVAVPAGYRAAVALAPVLD